MKFLQSQGYEVHAVSSSGKWVQDIEGEGIKVKTIGFKRKMFTPISDILSFFRLYLYFKKEDFDIVHTHTLKPAFYGQMAAKIADVPIIINTLHGLDFQEGSFLKKKIILLIEKISANSSDLVFSASHKAIDVVTSERVIDPAKIKYLGNGINTLRFNPLRFSEDFVSNKRKQLGIDQHKKVIGIVARLVAEKGYLDLFQAFKKVLIKFPEAVILAVGQDEPDKKDRIDKEMAKKYGIEDKVIFLGERKDVDELYSVMDVFVLPSHREGLPYTLLEASSMEKPVVATNVGGCPEAVNDGKTGLLVPAKNTSKLADAIIYFLSNPEVAKSMGRAGRDTILREFQESMVFSRLQKEYQRLIEMYLMTQVKKIKVCCISSIDVTLKFMLFNQLKFLQSQGYEVHAVSSPGKWVQDIEAEGIKVKTIGFKRKMFTPISDILSFFRLYFYFRKEKFHIVHVHTPKPAFYGQMAAKIADVPIIINTLHGVFESSSRLQKKLFSFMEMISAKFSDVILSISSYVTESAIKEKMANPKLIKYLGRDIDTERFNPSRFNQDFVDNKKKQLGVGEDKKVVGIVARMVAEKGYLDLFEAFKKVVTKFPNAMLMVIGQSEPDKKDAVSKEAVKQYGIEKSVMFLGERADTDELYPLMDIFVLPTHREGLGASILEASSMEKPVVATNVGGCKEAVDDGKTGLLVPSKNPNRLSEAIIDLLSDPEKASQMGKAGREKIIREFSKAIVLKRLGDYYQDLIEKKLVYKNK